jgi:hypothetical protein
MIEQIIGKSIPISVIFFKDTIIELELSQRGLLGMTA